MKENERLLTRLTNKSDLEADIEQLIEYKKKHRNFNNVTDIEISKIIYKIQFSKNNNRHYILTPEAIKKLDKIGFPWKENRKNARLVWFDVFYEKLMEYKEKNGDFYGVTQDSVIGKIVQNIRRKDGKRYNLTPEMIDKLNEIGFPWVADIKDSQMRWFPEFYEKLVAYKEKHGDFFGVTQDKEIGATVHNLRQAYWGRNKGYNITPDIIEKLEEIGFPWEADPKLKQDKWFIPLFEKLVKYKETHGGFNGVTQDEEIGKIIGNIRRSYKGNGNYKLTPEMIEKLNGIGFIWEAQYGEWFEPFFEKLVEYKKSHNGFYGATHDKEIGLKVSSIRKAYNGKGRYRLTPEMIDKLNSIGFPWSATPKKVQEGELNI